MGLSRGVRLGSYEVLSPLGAGGMGEVYRARDERLGRLVAIKVLPPAVASEPDRLRRFEREARSASALNHPNIVTIYEVGACDSISYIAMELVDGQPLRALLTQKPLPVRRVLDIGVQVAAGLAKAHDAGIVHRDLKPENVMVTEDGRVKILDFGLAKVAREDGPAGVHSPTVSAETQPGVLMGTVGYMSPEQATGRPADYRSDQFSLGTILYEMATARRAFHRKSAAQTLAAIIDEEPEPIAACNPAVPAPVRWIVERCLAKEPQDRFASTEDLARDLAMVRDRLSEASVPPGVVPPERKRPWRRTRIGAGLTAAILLALALAAWHLRETDYFWRSPLAGARFTRFTDWEGSELDAALSPDGKFVSFLSDHDGSYDVWVGQVGSGQFLNLTQGRHSEVSNPILRNVGFSDDGTYVWFRVNSNDGIQHSVLLAPTIGGPQRTFLPSAAGVAWAAGHDRIAYFPPGPGDPIFVADRNGGNARQVAIAGPGIHQHYVTWSPQGRFVYFVRGIPPDQMDVWRVPASGGAAERLTHHDSTVAYPTLLDERTLVYVATREDGSGSGSGLYAMDVERRIPHAVSVGLEEYVSVDASAGGRRLVATVANPIRDLWTVPITDHVVDESGARLFKLPTVRTHDPRFGPDYLVYLASKGAADGLWKLKDGSETELWNGSDGAVLGAPAISPDGSQVCFVVRTRQGARLLSMTADGTNAHRLSESMEVRGAPSWSPDGKWIAVAATDGDAYPLVMVPASSGEPVRLLEGKGVVLSNPVWSPDGRYILYSEGTGSAMLRLQAVTPDKRPFPLPEHSVGNTGDRYRFLPDGKHLVVMRGVLWQQDFDLLDLTTGQQRPLTRLGMPALMRSFDVSPDGKEILFDRLRPSSDVVLIDLAR